MENVYNKIVDDMISCYMYTHRELINLIKSFISHQRFEHCQRVAYLCVSKSHSYGLTHEHAFLSGIAHDICREYSDVQLLSYAYTENITIEPYEKTNPVLLHGKVAVVLLKKYYPMDNEIYEAIETHTLGCKYPTDMQKLLYICDGLDEKRSIWETEKGHIMRKYLIQCKIIDKTLIMLLRYYKDIFEKLHIITESMANSLNVVL